MILSLLPRKPTHGIELSLIHILGKSGSYIRGVTSGAALPSLRELFNIMSYFDMTPSEFFAPLENDDTPYRKLCEQLRILSDEDLEKISTFINWIT